MCEDILRKKLEALETKPIKNRDGKELNESERGIVIEIEYIIMREFMKKIHIALEITDGNTYIGVLPSLDKNSIIKLVPHDLETKECYSLDLVNEAMSRLDYEHYFVRYEPNEETVKLLEPKGKKFIKEVITSKLC